MTETAPDHARAQRAQREGLRDILAGFAIAGLILPEAVAYAGIASVPPGAALAAAIAGSLVYAVLGGSRFAIVSPTSSSAILLAAALANLGTVPQQRMAMVGALTLAIGGLLLAMAVFRLGSLSSFVSRPVLRGFAWGLAVSIAVRQAPHLTGLEAGHQNVFAVLAALLGRIGSWHLPSLALGLAAWCVLIGLRRWPVVPGALVVITASILLGLSGWPAASGIALAGPASLGMPHMALPLEGATWARIMPLAAPIALIIFAESWGTVRGLALGHGDTVTANRELVAIGLSNCASALVQGIPVGAGFSVGAASEAAGATSRIAAITAACAVLAVALFADRIIAVIPQPVLATIVISALSHALSPRPLIRLFELRRDQWIGLAAAVGVLCFGVLDGMLAAIALSLAELLYRLSHPSISELGQLGESHDFVDRARHPEARRLADLSIFRPNAPLFFANAEPVLRSIATAAQANGARQLVLSLEESNDLDSTAVEMLAEFSRGLQDRGCRVILARAHDAVRDVLIRAGLGDLAAGSTFSVADAVASITREP